jgi:mannose-6-phosphate isomerase-like protein (cupin superfamily)
MNYDFLYNGTIAMFIDNLGRDHVIDMNLIDYYIAEEKYTVKVEGLEKHFSEYLPNTVHCFVSPKNAPSFPEHLDPVDVRIVCIKGTKTLKVKGDNVVLKEGESIFLPANTPHQATNLYDSIILSIGYERTVDLSENHRNLQS